MSKRRSRIWKIPREELQNKLNTLDSFAAVLRSMGYVTLSGNYKILKLRIEEDNLDMTAVEKRRCEGRHESMNRCLQGYKIPTDEILTKDSKFSRYHLKKRLIEEELLEYKCKKCGNIGEWEGESLSLQLEHINGICNDHRLENLCFLCPNCHSQTKTFAGKNKKKSHICSKCNYNVSGKGRDCMTCSHAARRRFQVTKEELYNLIHIQKLPFTTVGKQFGVSDNAIRKRCKLLGVEIRRRSAKNPQD